MPSYSKIKINTGLCNPLLLSMLVLGLIEPQAIQQLSTFNGGIWLWLHILFEISRYFALLFSLITFVTVPKTRNMQFYIFILFYLGWLLFVNVTNGAGAKGALSFSIEVVSSILIFEYYIKCDYLKEIIKVFEFWLILLSLINILTQVVYSNGLYIDNRNWPMWFFGNKNAFVYNYFLCIILATLNNMLSYGKLRFGYFLLIALLLYSEIIGESVTSVIAILIPIILICIFRESRISKRKICTISIIASGIGSYLLIALGVNTSLGRIIEIFLNKNTTFTGRTEVWVSALNSVRQHLWKGSGWKFVPLNWRWDVGQSHNMFLDLLFVGGIPLLLLFLLLILVSIKRLNAKGVHISEAVFSYIFIGYCIVFLMEARRNEVGFFILLAMMFYSPNIDAMINDTILSLQQINKEV